MFLKAIPVFEVSKENEMNTFYGFATHVPQGDDTLLRIAGDTTYSVFINGTFVFSGPARAAHNFHRVDEIPLDSYLTEERNVLTIRLTTHNNHSYNYLCQPGFLCAEVVQNGQILAYTDDKGNGGIDCYALDEKLQKVRRYSFQRNFTEAYRLDERYNRFDVDPAGSGHRKVVLADQGEKRFIPRNVFLPRFEAEYPVNILVEGKILPVDNAPTGGEVYEGYGADLEFNCNDEVAKMAFDAENRDIRKWNGLNLNEGRYADLEYQCNLTGFLELTFTVTEECELFLLFDEVYNGNNVDYLRMACNNIHTFFAKPGTYHVMTQEPYTFRYLRVACRKGAVKMDAITIRRAGFPAIENVPKIDDPELKRIYDAAIETFRQNTYDIYMDCPSRERAGWLCDSFFTSRVERFLTGKTMVEENFLGNFIDRAQDPWLPEGMINMCYPSDHPDGTYIPNWSMWYVLEMEEYLAFTGNRAFVDSAKDLIYGLVNFFRKFKNSDGILEKLESWVFVEWSHANDLVQDVNYPSNMLFARMLRAVANLYDDLSLIPEAEVIEEYIRKNTMINGFFCDNSYRREGGSLELSGECTETCQYYAFYMGIATPETYPELWKKLTTDFGPQRKKTGAYPEIFFANAFIGNYLRLDLLHRYGLDERMVEEIRGYFLYMADKTGTLWEHDADFASCNHGFASYVAVLLRRALGV